jgi:hypothetical protein
MPKNLVSKQSFPSSPHLRVRRSVKLVPGSGFLLLRFAGRHQHHPSYHGFAAVRSAVAICYDCLPSSETDFLTFHSVWVWMPFISPRDRTSGPTAALDFRPGFKEALSGDELNIESSVNSFPFILLKVLSFLLHKIHSQDLTTLRSGNCCCCSAV